MDWQDDDGSDNGGDCVDGRGDDDDVDDQGGWHGPKEAGDQDVAINKVCVSTIEPSKLTRDSRTLPERMEIYVENFDNSVAGYEQVKLSITKSLKWILTGTRKDIILSVSVWFSCSSLSGVCTSCPLISVLVWTNWIISSWWEVSNDYILYMEYGGKSLN